MTIDSEVISPVQFLVFSQQIRLSFNILEEAITILEYSNGVLSLHLSAI